RVTPSALVATMATLSAVIGGCWAAMASSQADTPSSATPDPVAAPPSSTPSANREPRGRASRIIRSSGPRPRPAAIGSAAASAVSGTVAGPVPWALIAEPPFGAGGSGGAVPGAGRGGAGGRGAVEHDGPGAAAPSRRPDGSAAPRPSPCRGGGGRSGASGGLRGDPAGAHLEHLVDPRGPAGVARDDQGGAVAQQGPDRAADRGGVRRVQVGGGLVEQHDRRVPQEGAGQ